MQPHKLEVLSFCQCPTCAGCRQLLRADGQSTSLVSSSKPRTSNDHCLIMNVYT